MLIVGMAMCEGFHWPIDLIFVVPEMSGRMSVYGVSVKQNKKEGNETAEEKDQGWNSRSGIQKKNTRGNRG